jgi:hypothetical protein
MTRLQAPIAEYKGILSNTNATSCYFRSILAKSNSKNIKFEDKHTQNMPQSSNLYSNLGSNLAERIRQKKLIMHKT